MCARWGKRFLIALVSCFGFSVDLSAAQPYQWQLGFQEPASPVAEQISHFHNILMIVLAAIALLVMVLLIYVMLRFNEKRNPVPSKTTHHTMLEVVWTLIPAFIVVCIMIPGAKLIYFSDRTPDAEMTIKVVGHQWYWSYEYPDHGNFAFDSRMVPTAELEPGQLRLLEVDNRVILPVDTNIRILLTSTDVLHSWAVPAFGIKTDTVPGKLNETWVRINKEGTYYGQCSELCGIDHGFMPIAVDAVSKEKFNEWVSQKQQTAALRETPVKLAWHK